MKILSIVAGRLLCGAIRDFLKKAKLMEIIEDYTESSGFLEREFVIKGTEEGLLTVKESIEEYKSVINRAYNR